MSTTAESSAEGTLSRGVVRGSGVSRHVRVAGRVHRDSFTVINTTSAEVCGVNHAAGRVQFHYEDVMEAGEGRLKSAPGDGEVGATGKPRHVGVARRVHSDGISAIVADAPDVGGITQNRIDD